MDKLLFLDDWRLPLDCAQYMYRRNVDCKIYHLDWIVVRSYGQFVDYIKNVGLPDLISFDYDLSDVVELKEDLPIEEWYDFENDRDYKGSDCAIWLKKYCNENNLNPPKYVVHSVNPDGANLIREILEKKDDLQNPIEAFSKIFLLKIIVPYLKVLKNHRYITNRRIATFDLDFKDFTPILFHSYRFDYRPLLGDPVQTFEISLDHFTYKPYLKKFASNKYFVGDELFNNIENEQDLQSALDNWHCNALNILYKNDPEGFVRKVEENFPPDLLKNNTKEHLLYKSLLGIYKFNL